MPSQPRKTVRPDIADYLRQLRVWRGNLTQAQLARALEVESVTVSRWERGIVTPSAANLEAVAKALDVRVASFYVEERS